MSRQQPYDIQPCRSLLHYFTSLENKCGTKWVEEPTPKKKTWYKFCAIKDKGDLPFTVKDKEHTPSQITI